MTTPERGAIHWLTPTNPSSMNQLGLAIDTDDDETCFVLCTPDVELAGHLDPILDPGITNLDYTITVFTHISQWISHSRVQGQAVGHVASELCDEIEAARLGKRPKLLVAGDLLLDPIVEPRWPAIEQLALDFIDAFVDENTTGEQSIGFIQTQEEFTTRLIGLLKTWEDRPLISQEERDKFEIERLVVFQAYIENPHWCDQYEFYETTRDIAGERLMAAR